MDQSQDPNAGKDPIEVRYAAAVAMFGNISDEEKSILLNKLREAEAGAFATMEAHGYAEGYKEGYEIGIVNGKALAILFGKLAEVAFDGYKAKLLEILAPHTDADGKVNAEAITLLFGPTIQQSFLLGSSAMFMVTQQGMSSIDQLTQYIQQHN